MWPVFVSQLNFEFWAIILAGRSIHWLPFPLILGYFKIHFLYNSYLLHPLQILQFFSWKSIEKWVNQPFIETWCLKILTINLHNARKCAKSFQTPTSRRQHTNVNVLSSHHHHHCAATHCRHWAPWQMPTSGPTQGRLNDHKKAWMPTPTIPSFHLQHHHQQPQQTRRMTMTSWEGQRTLERVDRRGEGLEEGWWR